MLQIQTDQFIAVVIAWIAFGSQTVTAQGFAVPPETQFQTIAAGQYHNIAIRQDGTAVGWGYDEFGRASVSRDGDFLPLPVACGTALRCGVTVRWSPGGATNSAGRTDVSDSNNLLNH